MECLFLSLLLFLMYLTNAHLLLILLGIEPTVKEQKWPFKTRHFIMSRHQDGHNIGHHYCFLKQCVDYWHAVKFVYL